MEAEFTGSNGEKKRRDYKRWARCLEFHTYVISFVAKGKLPGYPGYTSVSLICRGKLQRTMTTLFHKTPFDPDEDTSFPSQMWPVVVVHFVL